MLVYKWLHHAMLLSCDHIPYIISIYSISDDNEHLFSQLVHRLELIPSQQCVNLSGLCLYKFQMT